MVPGIDPSPLTRVYRKVLWYLQQDPALQRTVQEWRTFTARDGASGLSATRDKVALALFPVWSQQKPETADSQKATLVIQAAIQCPATDAGDYLDLWFAVVKALCPADAEAQRAQRRALQAEGAASGVLSFQAPQVDAAVFAETKQFKAVGAIAVDVRLVLTP
jgi:hypothetical protein